MDKILITIGIFFLSLGIFIALFSIRNIFIGFAKMFFEEWKDWQIKRLEVCDNCTPHIDICPECRCFKIPKVKVKSEKCPLNKWQ